MHPADNAGFVLIAFVCCLCPDLLKHRSLFSDDDSFVGISLTYDRCIDIYDMSMTSDLHRIDHNSDSMRNLLA